MHTGFWCGDLTALGRTRHNIGKNNIKMCVREVGWGARDGFELAQDRDRWRAFVNAVMNHRVPLNAGNFWTT
jgi:hypothetical protein